ncbi:MAG: hypothetical protein E3J21_08625 [Anaerolineales bacterium]|nr:MAG: hypothetical protein E3J21_08625 [Anaerolineales bacterium]
MCLAVYVQVEERFAEAALVKGEASLTFEANLNKDKVLKRAANVAIEFDIDLYINGQFADAYEIRNTL